MPMSVMDVLAALHSAGEQGLTSGDIAEIYDPTRDHSTINAVNNILYRYRDNGRVRRSQEMEHLNRTTRTKVWRWYITPEGSRYYLTGGLTGQATIKRAEAAAKRNAARYRRERVAQTIATSPYGKHTPPQERRAAIARYYAEGLNKRQISIIFGITRERVRQIVDGMTVTRAQQDQLLRLLRAHPLGLSTAQIKASGVDFPGVMHRSEGVLREACHYLADQDVIVARQVPGQGSGGMKLLYTAPGEQENSC